MMAADAVAALIAGVIALEVRSGGQPRAASYVWFTFGLPVLWVACVALARGYEPRIIGTGTDEFRRVINAGIGLTVAIAIAFSLVTTGLSAGYVFIAMPLTLALDLAARCWLRRRLHRVQALGGSMRRAVAVGHARDVAGVVRMLRRERDHGLSIVAACLAGPDVTAGMTNVAGVPVYGGPEDVITAVREEGADTVAVLPCPELNGARLQKLAWSLEKAGTYLCLAPALLEIASPRTSIRAVAGLPLLHVDHPSLTGARQVAKTGFDKLAAALALILLAPLLLAIAAAIRLEDGGPVLARQPGTGRRRRSFRRYKFRTVAADSGRRTRTGAWLCRWSLHRIPQLVNVIAGQMSLVGPRPAGPGEAQRYSDYLQRRLDVRPGLTGLWVIRGLDLPPERAAWLDLRYVESWSFALDVQILWQTWSGVVRGTYSDQPRRPRRRGARRPPWASGRAA
jgi:lipopolysaccharide/colanic/teichoic acid biosynthesis glycosyltransferase